MGINSPEEHARRSVELQRLLDEADGSPTAPAQQPDLPAGRVRPAGRARVPGRAPAATARSPRVPADASGADDATSGRTIPSKNRSPLRSTPPSTFPRRVAPAATKPTAAPSAAGQRRAEATGDPSARLRRDALVRSSATGAGARRPRVDRSADPATKTAVARSLAGRWGASGPAPVLPEQRAVVEPSPAPVVAGSSASGGPSVSGPAVTNRPVSIPLSPQPRLHQRRALVLAGGVAAAVVAIVAIVSLSNRGSSGPAADAAPIPSRVVMVESTGADARPTVTMVTAQVKTVNGTVVALVPDATGRVRQLTVVTATPPAAATRAATPTAPTTAGHAPGPTATAGTTTTATTAPGTTTPATTAPATTAGPAPADPGNDVATVVTGLTTLTGWVPVTTG